MLNLVAAAPLLVLFLGASILLAIPARFHTRAPLGARIRLGLALVFILVSAIVTFINASQNSDPIALLNGPPLTDNLEITLHYDSRALFFTFIVVIAAIAQLLIENLRAETDVSAGALLILAGALAFFCADNWTTIVAAWLLADLGLIMLPAHAGGQAPTIATKLRAFVISQTGALLILAAGLLTSISGSPTRFDDVTLDGIAASCVLVAAWVRCAFWPFHFAQTTDRHEIGNKMEESDASSPQRRALFSMGIPAFMGISLLERALVVVEGEPEFVSALYALALFALAASALLALTRADGQGDLTWSPRALAAPLLLLAFVQPITLRPALAIWLGLGFFNVVILSAGAYLLRANTRREPWLHVLWGTALLVGSGFPFTPAFLGRIGFYAIQIQNGDSVLFVAVVGATSLALIPLWRMFLNAPELEPRRPTPVEYAAIALLLLPILVEGFVPFNVLGFFDRVVQDGGVPAYDALFHADNFLNPFILLFAIVAPLALSFFLARAWMPMSNQLRGVERVADRALELNALASFGARVVESIGVAVRQVTLLLEQHPIGWLVFVAIWLALWILGMSGGS